MTEGLKPIRGEVCWQMISQTKSGCNSERKRKDNSTAFSLSLRKLCDQKHMTKAVAHLMVQFRKNQRSKKKRYFLVYDKHHASLKVISLRKGDFTNVTLD